MNNLSTYDDVDYRFRIILILFFTVFLVDSVRYFFFLIGVLVRSKALMFTWLLFLPNDCLSVAAMIILHVWRFRLSG